MLLYIWHEQQQISTPEHSEQWFRIKELESLIDDEDRKRLAYRVCCFTLFYIKIYYIGLLKKFN